MNKKGRKLERNTVCYLGELFDFFKNYKIKISNLKILGF
jgi:hypothetical protein